MRHHDLQNAFVELYLKAHLVVKIGQWIGKWRMSKTKIGIILFKTSWALLESVGIQVNGCFRT